MYQLRAPYAGTLYTIHHPSQINTDKIISVFLDGQLDFSDHINL